MPQISLDMVWDYLKMLEFNKSGEVITFTHLGAVYICTCASVTVVVVFWLKNLLALSPCVIMNRYIRQ